MNTRTPITSDHDKGQGMRELEQIRPAVRRDLPTYCIKRDLKYWNGIGWTWAPATIPGYAGWEAAEAMLTAVLEDPKNAGAYIEEYPKGVK